MTDTPKPDVLEKLGVQGLPDKKLCDKYGNLLVYEKNRKIWSIVSYQYYLDYAVCFERWEYLPKEPEPELRTDHNKDDLIFLDRCARLFMAGMYSATVMLKKYLAKFTPDAKLKLLDAYNETENSLNLEYVLQIIAKAN